MLFSFLRINKQLNEIATITNGNTTNLIIASTFPIDSALKGIIVTAHNANAK